MTWIGMRETLLSRRTKNCWIHVQPTGFPFFVLLSRKPTQACYLGPSFFRLYCRITEHERLLLLISSTKPFELRGPFQMFLSRPIAIPNEEATTWKMDIQRGEERLFPLFLVNGLYDRKKKSEPNNKEVDWSPLDAVTSRGLNSSQPFYFLGGVFPFHLRRAAPA